MSRCVACNRRHQEIKQLEAKGFRPSEVFAITAPSHDQNTTHLTYYSTQGNVTLCAARRLELHQHYKKAAGV